MSQIGPGFGRPPHHLERAVELPFYGKYVILGVVGWLIVFSLIQEGLGELRAEKTR